MPTIRVFLPAALRRRLSSTLPFALTLSIAGPTQATGSASLAQRVTSLPPVETVISLTWPLWARRNFTAAAAWVWPAQVPPPGQRAPHVVCPDNTQEDVH